MATTTLGVKLDDPTRERLKAAAQSIDRTPHWLIKQAIFNYLEKLEGGATLTELNGQASNLADDAGEIRRFSNFCGQHCVVRRGVTRPQQHRIRARLAARDAMGKALRHHRPRRAGQAQRQQGGEDVAGAVGKGAVLCDLEGVELDDHVVLRKALLDAAQECLCNFLCVVGRVVER